MGPFFMKYFHNVFFFFPLWILTDQILMGPFWILTDRILTDRILIGRPPTDIIPGTKAKHKVKVTYQGQRSQMWRFLRSLNASCYFFFFFFLLFFYTFMKSWRGYIFTAVCLSVCPALLVNKSPAEWMNRLGRGAIFANWLLTALAQTLLKLVTLGQRSRS